MSEREQVMEIISEMPEYKIVGLLAFLRAFEDVPADDTAEGAAFYGKSNVEHILRGVAALDVGKGVEHELLEVSDE